MANLTINKTGNSIVVDFGAYAAFYKLLSNRRSYYILDIVEVEEVYDGSCVNVMMRDAHGIRRWTLTYDSTETSPEMFIVDDVDSVAPTSNSDLFDKITALRG